MAHYSHPSRYLSFCVAALVALAIVGSAVAGNSSRSQHRNTPDASKNPALLKAAKAADRRAARRADRRAARLRSPSARNARRHSRTSYKDFGRSASLRLARRSFDGAIAKPVWRGLDPGRGQRLRRYRDDFTAELEDASGTGSIATSTLPLRTRAANGTSTAVDLGLESAGDSYVPHHPLVPTRIAKRAGGGVTLGREALGVRPHASSDVTGTLTADRLFYPDTVADTDLIVEPQDAGAEVMWQLRSPQSPERHALRLDLPAGAKLRASRDVSSAVQIVRGQKVLAFVNPPTAFDADGTQVPATYEIAGNTLTTKVDHRSADIRYPVLVDPVFNVMEDFYDGTWFNQGWFPGGVGPAGFNDWNYAQYSNALHVSAKPWVGYWANDFIGWYWQAPRNAFMYRFDLASIFYYRATWEGSPPEWMSAVQHGLWSPQQNQYEGGNNAFHQDPSPQNDKPNYGLPAICAAWDCDPNAGTEQNMAVHALSARRAGTGNSAFSGMSRAIVYLRDRFRPKVLATSHSQNIQDAQDGRWLTGGINMASTPRATDWGLGLGRLELVNRVSARKISVFGSEGNPRHLWCSFSSPEHDTTAPPGGYTDQGPDKGDRNHRCVSAQTNPYQTPPDSQTVVSTFDYSTDQLDEGIHAYGVDAYDIIGQKDDPVTSSWTLKVDRSPPGLSLSGSLYDRRGQTLPAGKYNLAFNATEGSLSSPATARSGVKSVEIKVDGDQAELYEQSCGDSCGLSDTWVFDTEEWPTGVHRIEVTTTDNLGHQRPPEEFSVTVTGNPRIPGSNVPDLTEDDVTDPVLLTPQMQQAPQTAFEPALAIQHTIANLRLLTTVPSGTPIAGEDGSGQEAAEEDVFYDDNPPSGGIQPAQSNSRTRVGLSREGIFLDREVGDFGIPPDTHGAVSSDHYVEVTNTRFNIYTRKHLDFVDTRPLSDFVREANDDVYDPQIQWDQTSRRWLFTAVYSVNRGTANATHRLAYGWSKTSDPDPEQWCKMRFTAASQDQDDYPKLGHNRDHLIITSNVFRNGARQGSRIFVATKPRRNQTGCPTPAARRFFPADGTYLTTADGHQAFTPVPANTLRNTRLGYVVAADSFRTTNNPASQIMFWHVSGPASDPALTADANIDVAPYEVPAQIPQPGTNFVLDPFDTRLWQAVTAVDPDDGRLTVWTQHTVRGPENRAVVRWYELQPPRLASDPRTPRQAGVVASAAHHVFNGAISPAANGNDAGIHYNVSSATLLPSIRARTRLGSMPPGAMAPEVTLRRSPVAYQDVSCRDGREGPQRVVCRWGDYTGASPDPRNSTLIWGSNQYSRDLTGENCTITDTDGQPLTGPCPHWGTRNFALRPPSAP